MEAITHKTVVQENGTITVPVNHAPQGTVVNVIILLPGEDFTEVDLVDAAGSSTDFWDNDIDDQTWNHV